MHISENELLQRLTNESPLDLTELHILYATPEGLARAFVEIVKLELGLKIKSLYVSGNHLTYLPEGLFQGLSNLKILDLSYNQLSHLPEDLFQGLTSLQEIYLSGNQLNSLPEGLFHGLIALQMIALTNNQLSSLPARLFRGLTALEVIFSSINQLSSLPEGLFQGLNSLDGVDFSTNQLSSLPEGIFQESTNLKQIYLSGNQLSRLSKGLFQGLTNLGWLSLNNNRLSVLPLGLLDSLTLEPEQPLLSDNFNFGPEGEIHILPNIAEPSIEIVFKRITTQYEHNLDVLNRALDNTYPDLTFSDEQIKTLKEAKTRAEKQKTMLFQCIEVQGVPKEIGNIILSLTGHHFKLKP
jgi:Leucine-rich repeat (LRR) protein